MNLHDLKNQTDHFGKSAKMPVVFIGHGHPMNALLDNSFTQALQKMGTQFEAPNAILMISAHWQTMGSFVSTNQHPKTIYDFGRFDDRLFQLTYEPPGHPAVAKMVMESIQSANVKPDAQMGLDHGAWTVLRHIFPQANIPVLELSIDYSKPPAFHYQLGKELKSLREKGVLIMSSGNIVHNLYAADFYNMEATPFDWAIAFDEQVKKILTAGDHQSLVDYQKLGTAARYAIPTNDHYLPMLYTLGLMDKNEQVNYLFEGYQNASISMRCFSGH